MKIIITCEHGGNQIPKEYQKYFKSEHARLASHEGWDIGALPLAKVLARNADFFSYTEISRLLIDQNRSLGHKKLFSNITISLEKEQKECILDKFYYAYRNEVTTLIGEAIAEGNEVLHVSVHSFTPVLRGKQRDCDIGLLYDPKRALEKSFCRYWKEKIIELNPEYKVRFNYPYLGTADGLVTFLRKKFPEEKYVGLELEANQGHLNFKASYQKIESIIAKSFKQVISNLKHMPLH